MPSTPGKSYFALIASLQKTMLLLSYSAALVLPVFLAYGSPSAVDAATSFLFELSLTVAFLVLSIRPLADLLPRNPWIRPLVILRKGFGAFSASIIVSFMLAKLMVQGVPYLLHFVTETSWSLSHYAVLGTLADLSAVILLVTSNQFAKRILGSSWKRVQKLAYVYFAAGALYEFLLLGNGIAFLLLSLAVAFGAAAFVANRLPVAAAA
jgi:DMSO/TMAO reductase YedYZ heme-binding membrane subunit